MAAPNIKSPASIATVTGKTAAYSCTRSLSAALTNSNASGKLLKVEAIRAANVLSGGGTTGVDISHYRGTTHTYLAYSVQIPAGSTLIILSREEYLYLEEGDAIYATSPDAAAVDVLITYEEIG